MSFSLYLSLSVKNLIYRKLRSWLTVIGVIIGIFAVVSLITLGNGLQNAVTSGFETYENLDQVWIAGVNTMGMPIGKTGLFDEDRDFLESMFEVEYATSMIIYPAMVEYRKTALRLNVHGMYLKNIERHFQELDYGDYKGRFLVDGDKYNVFVGYNVANKPDDFFGRVLNLKNVITINGIEFRVIGIGGKKGNSDEDDAVVIPIATAKELFGFGNEITQMSGILRKGYEPDQELLDVISDRFERKYKVDRVFVTSPTQIRNQLESILGVVQFVIIGIAGISVVIGGIGIMNSMYTSVLERTKQIGVMKAVGAKNADIMSMFMIESGFIGLVGGIIGVGLGVLAALGTDYIIKQAGFELLSIEISYGLIAFALCFSFFIGLISGTLPAYRASQLKPVDSLRDE
jgi:putative ABC transport system permease protein